MIIIRTNHDLQTSYLYKWTEYIIKKAEQRGFKVIRIEGEKINQKDIGKIIKKIKPAFILFNGHGSSTALFDNKKNEFITIESAYLFKNTVTFTRACDCLNLLGFEAVNKGCRAFIGYRKKFWIARSHPRESQPLKDTIAQPILECSNAVIEELLKGKTVAEAIDISHQKAVDYILDLIQSKEPLAIASLRAVIANDAALGFHGDASATIC